MKNNRIGYSQVVPDSGFWTSIDQMINYFTQVRSLDRREILVHLENMKKRGYSVEYDPCDDETLNPMESRFAKEVMCKPVKWGWYGEGTNPEHKGIMEQVREAGAVESIMLTLGDGNHTEYSNGWVAGYAKDVARRLL